MGFTVCVHDLLDSGSFDSVSVPDNVSPDFDSLTKFLLPVFNDAPLPTVFQNVSEFPMHFDFMRTAFPETFGSMSVEQYSRFTMSPDERVFWAGAVVRFRKPCRNAEYGFTVYQNRLEYPPLTASEIAGVGKRLAALVPGGKILYYPMTNADISDSSRWTDNETGFGVPEVHDCGQAVEYEPYNEGTAYGYVRIFDTAAFAEASKVGSFGWQDIVVVDDVPTDLPNVTSAIITAARQNILSHINVRASSRGTPNAFIADAPAAFAGWAGLLVRLDVTRDGWEVDPEVTPEEATEWWNSTRPMLSNVLAPDLQYGEMPSLEAIPVDSRQERNTARARFGGKAANLALLTRVAGNAHVVRGFAVPFKYFNESMAAGRIDLFDGTSFSSVSFTEFAEYWFFRPEFATDPALRKAVLDKLRNTVAESAPVPPELVFELTARISAVFGSDRTMVRFRSSSNVEDSLEFNGAGLYESASACAADSIPGADLFSSACEPGRFGPEPIEDALRRVWASFWSPRAFEERYYYQYFVPSDTMMGILVTPAFNDETVNGVVFTGLPWAAGDDRMLVNAQVSETSVVRPPPGVLPETVILDVSQFPDGVSRVSASSLVTQPGTVMTDDEYVWIGNYLDAVRAEYPIDTPESDAPGAYEGAVVLDVEFKLDAERNPIFKQIRPFVRSARADSRFTVNVSPGSRLCGRFVEFRSVQDVRKVLFTVDLLPGDVVMPFSGEMPAASIVGSIHFGPDARAMVPENDPLWWKEQSSDGAGTDYFRFHFEQCFVDEAAAASAESDPAGRAATRPISLCLKWYTQVEYRNGRAYPESTVIDEPDISMNNNGWEGYVSGIELDGKGADGQHYVNPSSCLYENDSTYRRMAVLPGGDELELDVRTRMHIIGNGPAALVRAQWKTDVGSASESIHLVEDYWRLIYAAVHHNWQESMMFILETPVDVELEGATVTVHGLLVEEPYPMDAAGVKISYLDSSLTPVSVVTPSSYRIDYIAPK